jgi:hypothetical protein
MSTNLQFVYWILRLDPGHGGSKDRARLSTFTASGITQQIFDYSTLIIKTCLYVSL